MIPQFLISILILVIVVYIGYKMIYKPWAEKNLTPQQLEIKLIELERKKEVLMEIKEEIDVTKDLTKIEKELKKLDNQLTKVSKMRMRNHK